MKKLVLTSAGFLNPKVSKEFIKILSKEIKDKKILVISYAQNDNEQYYVDGSKKELEGLGFEKIEVVNMNDNFEVSKLGDFDAIYVCGGNTFLILDKLKETGLFEFILKQVENEAIYIGVSAGSIIAGENIEIAGWGSEGDENTIDLQNLSGLSFTDIAIYPHFTEDVRSEIEEFKKKVDCPVVELTDQQALFVIDGKRKVIG